MYINVYIKYLNHHFHFCETMCYSEKLLLIFLLCYSFHQYFITVTKLIINTWKLVSNIMYVFHISFDTDGKIHQIA